MQVYSSEIFIWHFCEYSYISYVFVQNRRAEASEGLT